ncbi:hypothetical protein [Campylobacter devanensis]|uniref:hypothetical protein n=1 Tax=Campylobacter devanensis TaxID=3161138 RepID=UPI000A348209|nr:hypothetical protein [Campylobacter sp. P157]
MRVFLVLVLTMILGGCAVSNNTQTNQEQKPKQTLFRIDAKCEPCSQRGYETLIDGKLYRSDVAINCCENIRTIDTSAALKKVYIHKVIDLIETQKLIKINGKYIKFDKNFAKVFYETLAAELEARGIYVASDGDSPYTYRVQFEFDNIKSIYSPGANYLNSKLFGTLKIKNINKNRTLYITTTQNVSDLSVNKIEDFDLYMNLLIKQSANKVAQEISKL